MLATLMTTSMIDLLPNEKPVTSLDQENIVLTNQRLVVNIQGRYRAIVLDQVSSVELEIKYKVVFILMAIVALGLGIFQGKELVGVAATCFIVMLGVYLLFPRKQIVMNTAEGMIAFDVSRLENSELTSFVFRVKKKIYCLRNR